jgi:hypothetical protein
MIERQVRLRRTPLTRRCAAASPMRGEAGGGRWELINFFGECIDGSSARITSATNSCGGVAVAKIARCANGCEILPAETHWAVHRRFRLFRTQTDRRSRRSSPRQQRVRPRARPMASRSRFSRAALLESRHHHQPRACPAHHHDRTPPPIASPLVGEAAAQRRVRGVRRSRTSIPSNPLENPRHSSLPSPLARGRNAVVHG